MGWRSHGCHCQQPQSTNSYLPKLHTSRRRGCSAWPLHAQSMLRDRLKTSYDPRKRSDRDICKRPRFLLISQCDSKEQSGRLYASVIIHSGGNVHSSSIAKLPKLSMHIPLASPATQAVAYERRYVHSPARPLVASPQWRILSILELWLEPALIRTTTNTGRRVTRNANNNAALQICQKSDPSRYCLKMMCSCQNSATH